MTTELDPSLLSPLLPVMLQHAYIGRHLLCKREWRKFLSKRCFHQKSPKSDRMSILRLSVPLTLSHTEYVVRTYARKHQNQLCVVLVNTCLLDHQKSDKFFLQTNLIYHEPFTYLSLLASPLSSAHEKQLNIQCQKGKKERKTDQQK